MPAETLYVAPDGNDAWSGRLARPNADRSDGPLARCRARDAVRKLKRHAALREPLHVLIADGTYPLAETVVFTPEDSGTQQCPDSLQAAPAARPVFSGGRTITGFQPQPDGSWRARVPAVAAGDWYFEQLWVNGRRATRRARPTSSTTTWPAAWNTASTRPRASRRNSSNRAFSARPDDLEPLQDLTPERLATST